MNDVVGKVGKEKLPWWMVEMEEFKRKRDFPRPGEYVLVGRMMEGYYVVDPRLSCSFGHFIHDYMINYQDGVKGMCKFLFDLVLEIDKDLQKTKKEKQTK